MKTRWRVFLDTSALFSAVYSESGGARLILEMGKAGSLSLWIGPRVLTEMDSVLTRKSPGSKGYFALLLDRASVQIAPEADEDALRQASSAIDYYPDAQVVAEALMVDADYFVSFDREHLVGNTRVAANLPFPIGTAGDFLAWYRDRLLETE